MPSPVLLAAAVLTSAALVYAVCVRSPCCPVPPLRPEAAPVFDFEAAHLPGFAAAEVEPLLRKLEMTSLLKDLSRMQGLMGGAAAADPQLQAALPAALQQVDASAAELQQRGAERESAQQQAASSAPVPQPTAPESDRGVESGDSSTTTTAAAGDRPAAHQEAADVLAAVPTVRLVRTPEGLHAFLAELQLQQQASGRAHGVRQQLPNKPRDACIRSCVACLCTATHVATEVLVTAANLKRPAVLCAGVRHLELATEHTVPSWRQAATTAAVAVLCLAAIAV